ncbi:MAG: hypothetical protein AAF915_12260 [Cyanobacteria bacterium P01_D01_bin.50]
MTQHQFLDQRFQEYNAALIKALENLATLLETEKCWQQSKLIRMMLSFLSKVESKQAKYIATIEEDIKNSLLLD